MIDNVLICFGVGTVMEDKNTDTDEVLVYVPSLFPDADGETSAVVEDASVNSNSPTGDTHSSTGLRSNGVPCKWLPFNTNRVTSPDVRKGSKVVVYKFKGTSTYRWMYFGMDGTLRLETIIMAISASPKVDEDIPFDTDHYYMILMSSHTGKMQILTGQGNGEATSYAITLDMMQGGFSFVDGEQNGLVLNSMERVWSMYNQDLSNIAMDKKIISLSCEDKMYLKGKESINMLARVINIEAEEELNIDVGMQTNLISPNIYVKGNVVHEGNTRQTGDYDQKGNYNHTGNTNQTGNTAITGNLSTTGTVKGSSGVSSGKFDMDQHKHGNGNDGNPTTSPIG